MINPFPIESDENLHFVCAGQPFLGRRFPFSETIAAHFAIPGDRIVMHQLTLTIPERGPLRTGDHLIICEDRTHVANRVLKNGGSFKFVEVLTIERELQRTKDRVGIRRYIAFK